MDGFKSAHETGDGPGQPRFQMPMNDLDPPPQTTRMVAGAVLGVLGLAGLVWAALLIANDRPAFIILILALLLLVLSLTSILSRFVHTPA